MPIAGKFIPFTKENVDNSPAVAGVYALFKEGELIYYGRAQGGTVTIRSRLQRHLAGTEGPCTKAATHYRREPCANPKAREIALIEEYKRAHQGRRPRCNEVDP
jgi:hypothetical protein